MRGSLFCSHCSKMVESRSYIGHVKLCIAFAIRNWDEAEYSKKYFAQVRAISRFKQVGDRKRRSLFKSWGWWLVKPDGPSLMRSEVTKS